jgi:hypothetical protein
MALTFGDFTQESLPQQWTHIGNMFVSLSTFQMFKGLTELHRFCRNMQILQGFKAQHQDDTKQIATGVLLYIVVSPKDLLLVGVPTFASCRPPSTDALRLALGTCR